jgi:hypothetical protein
MKMRSEDFAAMREAIANSFPRECKTPGKRLTFAEWRLEYCARGLSEERFRWDCLHASGYNTRPLYAYLHDSHIDTALRRIIVLLANAPPALLEV